MSANRIKTNRIFRGDAVVSCAMSLLWVGGYGYTYTDPFYNSSPVNWLAFILWAPGLFLTLRSYRLFLRYIKRPWLGIMVTWIAYFASLLLVEHIGYNVLTIRQVTSEGPLIFGLIHGTIPLKIYYVGAGIFAVFLSNILGKLLAPPYRIKKPLGKGVAGQPCRYDYHKESL